MATKLAKIIEDLRAAADALERTQTPPKLETVADRIRARRERLAGQAEDGETGEGSRGGAAYRPSTRRRRI